MDRLTYEDFLSESDPPLSPVITNCECCDRESHPFELIKTTLADDPVLTVFEYVCSLCIIESEYAAASDPIEGQGWESEAGKYLIAERDRLIAVHGGKIRPESRLNTASRTAFADYIFTLSTMEESSTVDEWSWPSVPTEVMMTASEYQAYLISLAG